MNNPVIFMNSDIGVKVYDLVHGSGIMIAYEDNCVIYSKGIKKHSEKDGIQLKVIIAFDNGIKARYSIDGRSYEDAKPSLFKVKPRILIKTKGQVKKYILTFIERDTNKFVNVMFDDESKALECKKMIKAGGSSCNIRPIMTEEDIEVEVIN